MLSAQVVEDYYSRALFPKVKWLLHTAFAWWPLAASGILIAVSLGWFVYAVRAHVYRQFSTRYKLLAAGLVLARSLAGVLAVFLLAWGFNYGRVPLADQLQLDVRELSTDDLWDELRSAAKYVSILRAQLPLRDTFDLASLPLAQGSPLSLEAAVRKQLGALGYPNGGGVRVRKVVPGVLLHFSTSGIYFPLTGEGHVDAGLHTLQVPFVTAHETLHGYGITDEGSCNFVAYLACIHADNLYLRYSGHLTYYRYVGAAVARRDPRGYAAFRQNLPAGVRADLDNINASLDKYTAVAPVLRDAIYDSYLKSQGVADGLASYSRLIDLVVAWRARPRPRPVSMPTID